MQTPLGEPALAFEGREDGLVVTVLRGFAVAVAEEVGADEPKSQARESYEGALDRIHAP